MINLENFALIVLRTFGVFFRAVLFAPGIALVVLRHALFDIRGGQVELRSERLVVILRHVDVVVFNSHAVLERFRHRRRNAGSRGKRVSSARVSPPRDPRRGLWKVRKKDV